ncbi:MAG: KpsF/GutQ family sugar-phosphate isomerase [Acidobacteriota bacterium]
MVTVTAVHPSLATAIRVLEAEAEAIRNLSRRLGEPFLRAVDLAAACTGKIAVTGLGKSGIICKKIAATLSSTGSPAIFMHAADALHGDCGLLSRDDLVLAISKSGETAEVLQVLNVAKRLALPVVAIAGDRDSTLAQYADVFLDASVTEEACPLGLAPTTSTAVALALGDALAMALMERKGFGKEDFASLHPAGSLGKTLMRVGDLMHRGESIPRVLESTRMSDAIYEMTRKSLGMTAVTDERGILVGVISDGDLRRMLQKSPDPLNLPAGRVMSKNPRTISEDELATVALSRMEELKITSLVVIDKERAVIGVVHVHDLWRTQLF